MEDLQNTEEPVQETKPTKKQQFIQILKFTGFSISAGVIQLLSFTILYEWAACLSWWPAYLISIILSVIWNFTFNRKFTFKAANNVPLAMGLVIVYYCAFIPVSVFGGNALEAAWDEKFGILVTVIMMLINFVTEFLWDKFIVFNQKVTDKILNLFKKKN
ncbi:MAG: GtrA family protein [Clostridia bacterium]|nr:GtrA family protein [Clostridia bacterium]